MATEVKIPELGESISSGIIAKWHVSSGDYVESGQTLFELETDKITSEGTAETSGVIELKAEEGDEVEIGSVVAVIDESASKDDKGDSKKKKDSEEENPKDSDDSKEGDSDEDDSKEEDSEETDESEKKNKKKESEDSDSDADDEDESDESKKKDSGQQHPPSVRRLADEHDIDPDSVEGTGKDGRVTKEDMEKAVEAKKKSSSESSEKAEQKSSQSRPKPSSSSGKASGKTSRKKMTPLRRTIAQRLVNAQQTTAMLTTFNEVDMSAVMSFRKKHQDAFTKKHDVKLGFMSFFTKAVVQALKSWPAVNAQIDGQEIVTNHYYDIGIAVSTPKGLMVPVVRDCDDKSFADIEKDIIAYANKAKDGKISIDDLQGGVFTITNGGIFGSMLSTPILNTPQSAILGMHTIQQRPVAVDGEVVIRPMMYLALSYDHRLVDGREAVGFLVSVKEAIEDPVRLMFEI